MNEELKAIKEAAGLVFRFEKDDDRYVQNMMLAKCMVLKERTSCVR